MSLYTVRPLRPRVVSCVRPRWGVEDPDGRLLRSGPELVWFDSPEQAQEYADQQNRDRGHAPASPAPPDPST